MQALKSGLAGGARMLTREVAAVGRDIARGVKGAARGLVRPTRVLSPAQASFVERNAAFWGQLSGDARSNGYVLVEFQAHPLLALTNASFAAAIAHAHGLRPLFVMPVRNHVLEPLFASYPGATFTYLHEPRHAAEELAASARGWAAARKLRDPQDLLAFQTDGIRFGDVLYDSVLATGYATIRELDWRVVQAMRTFFFYRSRIADITRTFAVKAYVGHSVGLLAATFVRYLLTAGAEVFIKAGAHELVVKKWQHMGDLCDYVVKPEARYFRYMVETIGDTVEQLADDYLRRRFAGSAQDISADAAFHPQKRVFATSREFCEAYGLDPAKKLVFVMLHEFTDYPHSHFKRPLMFQDYYRWFEATLQIARSTPSVNWVFKEHPAASLYPTRDLDLHALFAGIDDPHIRFLANDAPFNGSSITAIGHAIVTCLGTPGLEHACGGVPCVLGGESPYSDFGFTLEPPTVAEYEKTLRTIANLPRLDARQIRAAKAVLFFELCLMNANEYLFCPRYPYSELRRLAVDQVWRDAAALMDAENVATLSEHVEQLRRFILNPQYRQYIDLVKFPFMAGVVPGGSAGTADDERFAACGASVACQ
jgi:hypothetical protein